MSYYRTVPPQNMQFCAAFYQYEYCYLLYGALLQQFMSAIRMTALYSANTSIILNHMLPCAAFCQLYYYSQPYMALCCILSSLVPFSTICCPVLHSAKSSTIMNHMLPCHFSPRLKSSCLYAEFHQHYYHY